MEKAAKFLIVSVVCGALIWNSVANYQEYQEEKDDAVSELLYLAEELRKLDAPELIPAMPEKVNPRRKEELAAKRDSAQDRVVELGKKSFLDKIVGNY